ncbi:MAG: flagellar M-ring protein FliF [Nitrosomonas sp.]|nr:flagellar M-ring protein FliF [Nitrosomonas sp.]
MATVPNEVNTANSAAVQPDTSASSAFGLDKFNQLSQQKKLGIMVVAAATVALLVGAWLWSQSPDYRVLFSNVSDQDGAAIISTLQQSNVPYKLSDGGGAILVPNNQVHEIRLRLAGQGLPRSGLAGFELMENQKFGTSQFLEQVNYQRALEGELARSVQSLAAVQSARVHLAISKPSVFARERQQPTVSVLLNLYPGRVLGEEQVSAIVHLVSSSIPSLPTKNVTVVDQNGNLLSGQAPKKESKFDAKQLEYLHELEKSYVQRIEKILSPITGSANVRAQVTADLDFSRIERAEEIYRPNNTPDDPASVRSQQTMESLSTGNKFDGGIPGALTNRPPEPAIAPIELEGEDGEKKPEPLPTDQRKESTINYEVDKTIQHTQLPTGNIRRLSAAVVVNYRRIIDEEGNVTYAPLSGEEIREINQLVKNAIGYNEERGDTLTVTNNLFSDIDDASQKMPLWQDPDIIMAAMEIGKQLIIAAIVLFFLLKVLRPFLKSLTDDPALEEKETAQLPDGIAAVDESGHPVQFAPDGTPLLNQEPTEEALRKEQFEKNLKRIRQMAIEEPAIVANVVKEWVNNG